MDEQTKSISQREVRKGENWILYLRANKKVKEKIHFKSFRRKKNLCVESTGPGMALSLTRERQKPQEIRKRQFRVKRLKS